APCPERGERKGRRNRGGSDAPDRNGTSGGSLHRHPVRGRVAKGASGKSAGPGLGTGRWPGHGSLSGRTHLEPRSVAPAWHAAPGPEMGGEGRRGGGDSA